MMTFKVRVRRGISMVEAMMVVLLVSATASAAVFKISTATPADSTRQTAQQFADAMREARDLAVKKQAPVTVHLDKSSQPAKFVFKAGAGLHGPATDWEFCIDEPVAIDGTVVPIRFDASGNASYMGQWQLNGSDGYAVTLEPIGGKVTMKSMR